MAYICMPQTWGLIRTSMALGFQILSCADSDPGNKTIGKPGGCQNYGPFLGTLNIRCQTIVGTQKGIMTLTTTHITHYSSFHFIFHYSYITPIYTL